MDWSKGYSISYYMTRIDPITWHDIERIEIIDGSIKRESGGMRESATVDCTAYPRIVEQWIRIWLDIEQTGANQHIPLFTGLATSPARDFTGDNESNSIECYSVLKPASDVYLLRGWYAPAGRRGAEVIKELLADIPAPVSIAEDSPALQSHIIAEDTETHLTMIEKILTAINWRMRILGDGTVRVEPKPSEPVATFDPIDNDVIETEIKVKEDWFSCPNVFMAIANDLMAIARDDSINSPLSTVNRGREVWRQETSCDLADNETIEQYALRRLKELQKTEKTASYDRRFMPNVYPGDAVRLHYPAQSLDGVFTVSSQSIDLSYAARTSEEIIK